MEQKIMKEVVNLDEAIDFYMANKRGVINCIYGDEEKVVDNYQDAADFFIKKEKENKNDNDG